MFYQSMNSPELIGILRRSLLLVPLLDIENDSLS